MGLLTTLRRTDNGSGPILSCAYPLNAPSSEITSYMGLGWLPLTMSNSNTTGTYTVLGAPASQKTAVAAPVGFSTASSATLAFTSGIKVIAWGISVPVAVDTGSATDAYRAIVGVYTTAFATVASIDVQARKNGTWTVRVLRGAGVTQVYIANGLTACPSTVALVMDADTSTFAAYIDGVPVTLSADGFTPANMIAVETVVEFTTSDSGDAGKLVSATQYTEAATIPGNYPKGTTDPCGNNLPANYLVDNLGNLLEDNSGNLLVWV